MNTPFEVKKGQVIEAGEGHSFTAKRDGMAYWDGDALRMTDPSMTTPTNTRSQGGAESAVQTWCGINGVYKNVRECKHNHAICECGKLQSSANAALAAPASAQEAPSLPALSCKHSNRSDCGLFGVGETASTFPLKMERPSREWYADKIQETLDEDFVIGAERFSSDECDKPPAGWHCTREKGHTGPCAAQPLEAMTKEWCAAHPGSAAYMINALAKEVDASSAALASAQPKTGEAS